MEEIYVKNKMVVLEWVKGHEDMPWEEHNWVSKLKMNGNERADEEAKKALRKEKSEEIQYDKYVIKNREEQIIQWTRSSKIL